jgi:LDH2 family malate/lactate/ureidoglycolate dehydrogenase
LESYFPKASHSAPGASRLGIQLRRGALLPFGGYKGFGLALMMQALGLLARSGLDAESDYGYLFIAFRPDLLGPADAFGREVTQLIQRIKATPRQPGVDDIRTLAVRPS